MSIEDIRQERDEFQQVLIEIAALVAPFTDEDITDPTCDPDHIVRAVESAVAHTQPRDPRQHAYGSCPTQVTGNTLDGVPFYFRARYGRWELWAPYTSTEEVLVASGEDETYGSMHADDVDKIIDAHLGTGWTNGGVR